MDFVKDWTESPIDGFKFLLSLLFVFFRSFNISEMGFVCLDTDGNFIDDTFTRVNREIVFIRLLLLDYSQCFWFFFGIVTLDTHLMGSVNLILCQIVTLWLIFLNVRLLTKWLVKVNTRVWLAFVWHRGWHDKDSLLSWVLQHRFIIVARLAYFPKTIVQFEHLAHILSRVHLNHPLWIRWILWLKRHAETDRLKRGEMLLFFTWFDLKVEGSIWINWAVQVWHNVRNRFGGGLFGQTHWQRHICRSTFLTWNTCLNWQLENSWWLGQRLFGWVFFGRLWSRGFDNLFLGWSSRWHSWWFFIFRIVAQFWVSFQDWCDCLLIV